MFGNALTTGIMSIIKRIKKVNSRALCEILERLKLGVQHKN